MSGSKAQQLYGLEPVDAADTPPDSYYGIKRPQELPIVDNGIHGEVSFRNPVTNVIITRTGGGHEFIFPTGVPAEFVSGPFPLPMMKNAQATKSDGILRDPVASRVFERLAAILNDYADRRHLAIRRYQQNQPIWMFHFLHPKGGVGAIELAYSRLIDEAQGRLFVCAFWYCDDDEALTRHSHDPSAPEFMESDIDVVKLLAALEHQLAIVLAWDRSDLKRVSRISAGRPKDERGNPTSELEKRFRLPVIDG